MYLKYTNFTVNIDDLFSQQKSQKNTSKHFPNAFANTTF